MSECAKCNGWGVDDVTGFACPSCPTVKQSLTVEPVSNPDDLTAAMQADAAPVATSDRQDAIEAAQDVLAGRGNGTYDEALDAIRWLLQSAGIHDAPVDDRVSTSNPVVDHETGNTSDKLRPAVEVWRDAYDAFTDFYHHTTEKDPARVIEADRQATRAALVAEIVEWLRKRSRETLTSQWHCAFVAAADEIEVKWGKQ